MADAITPQSSTTFPSPAVIAHPPSATVSPNAAIRRPSPRVMASIFDGSRLRHDGRNVPWSPRPFGGGVRTVIRRGDAVVAQPQHHSLMRVGQVVAVVHPDARIRG